MGRWNFQCYRLGGIDFNGKYSVAVIGEFDVWLNRVVLPPKIVQSSRFRVSDRVRVSPSALDPQIRTGRLLSQ